MPICKVCGKEYKRKDSRSRKTCGDPACRRRWKNVQEALSQGREPFIPHTEECPYCQEMFLQTQSNQTICPKHECKAAHKRKKARERYAAVHAVPPKERAPHRPRTETRFCAWCGRDFPAHFQSPMAFCSTRCEESERSDRLARAFLTTVKDPFADMYTLPPGCRSWYQAEMTPVM